MKKLDQNNDKNVCWPSNSPDAWRLLHSDVLYHSRILIGRTNRTNRTWWFYNLTLLWHSIFWFWSGPSPRWTTINNLTMSFNKARVRPDSPYSIVYWVNTIYFQQLATFSRVWYLFDAKWQCPHLSGERIARILRGEHKPIYYPGGKLFISIPKNLLSTDGLP